MESVIHLDEASCALVRHRKVAATCRPNQFSVEADERMQVAQIHLGLACRDSRYSTLRRGPPFTAPGAGTTSLSPLAPGAFSMDALLKQSVELSQRSEPAAYSNSQLTRLKASSNCFSFPHCGCDYDGECFEDEFSTIKDSCNATATDRTVLVSSS